jgi:hypothetical protein
MLELAREAMELGVSKPELVREIEQLPDKK